MKQTILALLLTLFVIISCQNRQQNGANNTKSSIENKFYYVEFLDLDNSSISRKTISLIKKRIFAKAYILTSDTNDWQGIKEIDTNELIDISIINKSFQNVHRFKNLCDSNPNDLELEKIVITYNKPQRDTVPNFNYHSYKRRGHAEWQSMANPGNFTYKGNADPNEMELANYIINKLVLLTFK
jgi:hypothetical protein